jgi:hypothetical protein
MDADLLTRIPTLEAILDAHTGALGDDFTGYRHHAYRVVNFCAAFSTRDPARLEVMAFAAAFHDLGIWTARTFDYLPPSMALADAHLRLVGLPEHVPEVTAMIEAHHKVSAATAPAGWLVEPFRRADWVDVTFGLRAFGMPRPFIARVRQQWPDAGFHWRLVQLSARRLATHPLRPLPMFRR